MAPKLGFSSATCSINVGTPFDAEAISTEDPLSATAPLTNMAMAVITKIAWRLLPSDFSDETFPNG
jgi:hypothetical protein